MLHVGVSPAVLKQPPFVPPIPPSFDPIHLGTLFAVDQWNPCVAFATLLYLITLLAVRFVIPRWSLMSLVVPHSFARNHLQTLHECHQGNSRQLHDLFPIAFLQRLALVQVARLVVQSHSTSPVIPYPFFPTLH